MELGGKGLFQGEEQLDPTQFTIDSFHRFEGPSDPGDMSIVYAIRSATLNLKGLLVGSYGSDAEMHIHRMMRPLAAHHGMGSTQPVQPAGDGKHVKY